MNKNLLETLPQSFGLLTNLEHLELDENKFIEFPEAINKLANLKLLFMRSNNMEKISMKNSSLTKLQNINLS